MGTIGVAIPSATHGFMGGLNFHAQDTIKRLQQVYPQLDFVLATAGNAGKMVNDIEDMVATRNISALVVLPFESEPLTSPVQAVKEAGIWVTVVDRGLSVEGIEDLYVAGDNPGFGRVAGSISPSISSPARRSSSFAAFPRRSTTSGSRPSPRPSKARASKCSTCSTATGTGTTPST